MAFPSQGCNSTKIKNEKSRVQRVQSTIDGHPFQEIFNKGAWHKRKIVDGYETQ